MAMESPALAHALVAWSSGHLSSIDHLYRITALEARSASLRALVGEIHSDDISFRETNAGTGLILLTSEVCLGDYSKWYNHLIGVRDLIMSTRSRPGQGKNTLHGPDALKQSREGRWILRNFAYHDVLGSVTLGKCPLIKARYLHGMADGVDSYLGVATGILAFISEISDLGPTELVYHAIGLDGTEENTMTDTFYAVESNLRAWTCPIGTLLTLEALAYTYRSAALIYLYRQTYRSLSLLEDSLLFPSNELPHTLLQCKIQTEVATVIQHVASIPSNAPPETALLFPLFMAGAETVDESHKDMIRTRLRLMLDKRPFQNIRRAWEVLEKLWAGSHGNKTAIDWHEVIDQQDGGLLLT